MLLLLMASIIGRKTSLAVGRDWRRAWVMAAKITGAPKIT